MNCSPPPNRLSAGARSRDRAASESLSAQRGVQSQQRRVLSCTVSASQSNQFKDKLLFFQFKDKLLFLPGPSTGPSVHTRHCHFPPPRRLLGRERLAGVKELLPLGLNRVSPGPEQAEEPKLGFESSLEEPSIQNPLKSNGRGALALSGAVEHLSPCARVKSR